MRLIVSAISVLCLTACAVGVSQPSNAPQTAASTSSNMIMVRQSSKTPEQVVDAIRTYAETNKWAYLGANKVKSGEVTLVKICIPAVGVVVWGAGLEYSALLPCGNLAVYQKGGRTELSMLDPRYMVVLAPGPETSRAGEMATPLLLTMLDEVTR